MWPKLILWGLSIKADIYLVSDIRRKQFLDTFKINLKPSHVLFWKCFSYFWSFQGKLFSLGDQLGLYFIKLLLLWFLIFLLESKISVNICTTLSKFGYYSLRNCTRNDPDRWMRFLKKQTENWKISLYFKVDEQILLVFFPGKKQTNLYKRICTRAFCDDRRFFCCYFYLNLIFVWKKVNESENIFWLFYFHENKNWKKVLILLLAFTLVQNYQRISNHSIDNNLIKVEDRIKNLFDLSWS